MVSRVNGQWLDTNTTAPPIATTVNNPPILIQLDNTLDLAHQSIEWTEIFQSRTLAGLRKSVEGSYQSLTYVGSLTNRD